MVVVAAGLVDADEDDVACLPGDVLFLGLESRIAALASQRDRLLAKTQVRREEEPAKIRQPLLRIEGAVIGPVAVGPLVVTRQIDRSLAECVE